MNHKQNLETYDPKAEASFYDRLEVYKATLDFLQSNPRNMMGLCWLLITYYLKGNFDIHDLSTEVNSNHVHASNTTTTFPELLKLVPDMHASYNSDYTNKDREKFLFETIRAMEAIAHQAQRV